MIKNLALSFSVVVVLAVSGCQSVSTMNNPYSYRFNSTQGGDVCLKVDVNGSEALVLQARTALEDKGFRVREVDQFDSDCERCLVFKARLGGWASGHLEYAQMILTRLDSQSAFSATIRDPETQPQSLDTPGEDHTVAIRTLVDRLFPDPVPWSVEKN